MLRIDYIYVLSGCISIYNDILILPLIFWVNFLGDITNAY